MAMKRKEPPSQLEEPKPLEAKLLGQTTGHLDPPVITFTGAQTVMSGDTAHPRGVPLAKRSRPALARVYEVVGWVVGGALGLGALLDALANSSSFFSVKRAAVFTVLVAVGWAALQLALSKLRPAVEHAPAVRVRSIGRKPTWALLGGLILVWAGALWGDWLNEPHVTISAAATCPPSFEISVIPVEANVPAFSAVREYPTFHAACRHAGLQEINQALVDASEEALADYIVSGANAREMVIGETEIERARYIRELGLGAFARKMDFRCRARLVTTTIISVLCLRTYFLGGAFMPHPFPEQQTFNFQVQQTGTKELTLDDVLVQGEYAYYRLLELVRGELATQHTIDEDIADKRDIWRAMRQGFGLTRQGLVFRFERYDSGAYVDGVREVLIPYTRLGGIMRSDGLHASLVH